MKKNVIKFCSVGKASQKTTSIKVLPSFFRCPVVSLERFSIAFAANGKRQAEISRLQKTREINLFSAYILPVSHSYGASTKNRELS